MARMDMTIRNPERDAAFDAELKADGLPGIGAWLGVTVEIRPRSYYRGVLGTYWSDTGPRDFEDEVVGSQLLVHWTGVLPGEHSELGDVWMEAGVNGPVARTRVDRLIERPPVFDTPS